MSTEIYVVQPDGGVNMRDAPCGAYMLTLPRGAEIKIITTMQDFDCKVWGLLQWTDRIGWGNMEFIEPRKEHRGNADAYRKLTIDMLNNISSEATICRIYKFVQRPYMEDENI